MLDDQNRRMILIELLIASGLTTIGFAAGQGPLFTLAGAAAGGIGINWVTSLAQSGFHYWRKSWLTQRGGLNQDIVEALLAAFKGAIDTLEREWKQHPHYLYLQRAYPSAAQETRSPFRWLREDATHLFQQEPALLVATLQRPEVAAILDDSEDQARRFLADKVEVYLYGYDNVLVDFIKRRLADEWLVNFGMLLRDPGEKGTRAWRAYQRLQLSSLELAVSQFGQHTAEVAATVHWLQEWARRLQLQPSDSTGTDALENMLRSVRDRLSEINRVVERAEARAGRIEEHLQRIELTIASNTSSPLPFLAPPLPHHSVVGREILLREIKDRLFTGKTLALTALDGLPGVGKTTLAIALAHDPEVREYFPDGVLWAGLGCNAQEADILSHLGMWGSALGISPLELEKLSSLKAQQQRIQASIGQRRMLLIVDDVWKAALALELMLGGDNCAYVVTTRLPAVAEEFSSQEITTVRELNEEEGLTLLELFVPEAVRILPDEARALVQAVGGLPLALILMGKFLRRHLHHQQTDQQKKRRLRTALDRLQHVKERLRLAMPQAGLERHPSLPSTLSLSLSASIDISYTSLTREARRMLRALSVFPAKPSSFTEEAALTVSFASIQILDALTDAGLLESDGQYRYTLHQTIHDFTRVKGTNAAAEKRLVDYFAGIVETHTTDDDYGRLSGEMSNILIGLEYAYERKMDDILVHEGSTIARFLTNRGMNTVAETLVKRVEQAATVMGDTAVRARMLYHMGQLTERSGDHVQEESYYKEALTLARSVGDDNTACSALNALGTLSWQIHSDYQQAAAYLQEGLSLAHQAELLEKKCLLLQTLGWITGEHGDYTRAEMYLQEGLMLAQQLGPGNVNILCGLLQALGWVSGERGNYPQAQTYLQDALALARQYGYTLRVSQLLRTLGAYAGEAGKYAQAEIYLQEGLTLAHQMRDHGRACYCLEILGKVAIYRGDYAQAEAYLLEGLQIAEKEGHTHARSSILCSLGKVVGYRGDYVQAEAYLLEGLILAHDTQFEIIIVRNLGRTAIYRGDYVQAEAYLQKGLILARKADNKPAISSILCALSEAILYRGDFMRAEVSLREGLSLAGEIGSPRLISECLGVQGELYFRQQQFNLARASFLEAMEEGARAVSKLLVALAEYGIARAIAAEGKGQETREHGETSLTLFKEIGHVKANEVEHWMARLPPT